LLRQLRTELEQYEKAVRAKDWLMLSITTCTSMAFLFAASELTG
jgi:hypothetical protein